MADRGHIRLGVVDPAAHRRIERDVLDLDPKLVVARLRHRPVLDREVVAHDHALGPARKLDHAIAHGNLWVASGSICWLSDASHGLSKVASRQLVRLGKLRRSAMPKAQDLLRRIGEQPRVARLVARITGVERTTLITLIIAASVLFAFAKLADAVGEGGTRAFDEWLLLALRTPGQSRRSARPAVVRGDDARLHRARQHRRAHPDGAGRCRLPRHDPQGLRRPCSCWRR